MNRRVAASQVLLLLLLGLAAAALLAPREARGWWLAANTVRLAVVTCALAVPLGTALAILLFRTDLPGRRTLLSVLAWLLFVPLFLQVGAWQAGFGLQGWQTLAGMGPAWLEGFRGAAWVHAAAAVPWVALIVGIGLRTIRPELEEAALLDASPLEVLWHVTLPHVAPLLLATVLWVSITVAGEIAVTDMFQVRTYAEELYTEIALGGTLDEAPLRILPGIVVTGWMALAATLLVLRLAPRERQAPSRPPLSFQLGRWRWPLFALVVVWVALLVGLPMASLAWKCGVEVVQMPLGRERHWSLVKCLAIVVGSPGRYHREIASSLITGSTAATAATIVGALFAWGARRSRGWSGALVASIACGLALPGPVLGIAIIKLMNRPGWPWALYLYDRTIVPCVVAQMVRALPLACLMLWYAFETIPADELEAAELDGAGAWARFRRVALPQRWFAVVAAWLMALAVAIAEIGATILVVPPGVEPLSVRISGLLHYGVEDQVAGICLGLGILYFALVGTAVLFGKHWSRPAAKTRRH